MAHSKEWLDELRRHCGLVDTIGRTVSLKKRGREFAGLCPFHKEKSPSFTVNEEKGFYHCFGCGSHGDVIGFTMRVHNIVFLDAVRRLADEAGLTLEEDPS